ncbi:MAG TPA: copper homeostasis membrane protein CopD [Sphingobium sp.]|nr:copper homeostasis membrane protein CopD [Sphingobium sp.]
MPFDGLLVALRFALYADLTALAGLPLFWWSMGRRPASRRVLVALALGGLVLSALWLLASAAGMAGTPLLSPDWSIVAILLQETPVGTMLAIRAAALLLTLVALAAGGRKAGHPALVTLTAAIAAATLAWSGHAAASEGVGGSIHRIADALHVWAAAGWFGALLALLGAAFQKPPQVADTARMLERFSIFGTIFVATLILTGALNSVMIVGIANLPALLHSLYGALLLAKLALFAAMLLLAAANRWHLTPRLQANAALTHLRLSLLVETVLALGILALVAALGTLDPLS